MSVTLPPVGPKHPTGTDDTDGLLLGPYFGHATFEDYFASRAQKMSNAPPYARPRSKEETMAAMLKRAREAWPSVIDFIRNELGRNPGYRTALVWYFVMPESRAAIPAAALAVADACGAGSSNSPVRGIDKK